MKPGDILGHEPMGIVQEVGAGVTDIAVGDRVVIPFNISWGHCFMCSMGLQSQCETTQVREQNKGAALFGFSAMYGSVPGGQAEYLRVPQAQYGPIKIAPDGPDERYLFLSDICPPHGNPWSTRTRRRAAPWRCSGSARSASSPPGSGSTGTGG